MTHLVITGSRDGKNVIWKEKVSAAEYFGTAQRKEKAVANINVMTAKQRGIIPIAAFTAKGDLEHLKNAIDAGLNAGLSINKSRKFRFIFTPTPDFLAP